MKDVLIVGYDPIAHEGLKRLGNKVTSVDPYPENSQWWVNGEKEKERLFKQSFSESKIHHVYVMSFEKFVKQCVNKYDEVFWIGAFNSYEDNLAKSITK